MASYRAQGVLAAGFGLLVAGASFVACGEPELKTGLRPEGNPEVLAVLVINENFDEQATYCAPGDNKVPVIIPGGCGTFFGFECCAECTGICPAVDEDVPTVENAVGNAEPLNWWARVVFDELLDPDIETLEDADFPGEPCTETSLRCNGHINTTMPVTLQCNGVDVAYDGFYDPTGNNVTLPPGPSLVVYPVEFVATSATCTLSVNDNVVDKDGNSVEADDFEWTIAALNIVATDPEPTAEVTPDTVFTITFNSYIDPASIDAGEITLVDADGTAIPFTIETDPAAPTDIYIVPSAELPEGAVTLTITPGAEFADIGGGPMTVADAIIVDVTVVPAA